MSKRYTLIDFRFLPNHIYSYVDIQIADRQKGVKTRPMLIQRLPHTLELRQL